MDQDPTARSFFVGFPLNLDVFFWRWATWKVWESTPADDTGVVCFVTTSSYLRGTAFTAMRRYLRETASEGWIIDLTPEGQTPDVPTRVFPGVGQTLAIGVFAAGDRWYKVPRGRC